MSISEKNIIAARAAELSIAGEYALNTSKILSPAEQVMFFEAVRGTGEASERCFFYGGCAGAERRAALFLPSYIDFGGAPRANSPFSAERERFAITVMREYGITDEVGIVPLEINGSDYSSFTHRACMGSILSLGLERDVVGDIAVLSSRSSVIFVSHTVADFITENLTRIGRDAVKVKKAALDDNFTIPRSFETFHLVCSSERLDGVAAALANISRTAAKELCLSGKADVNYVTHVQPDFRINTGDTVSVRGYGKFIIDSFDGETRSGRLRMTVRKYI